LSVALLIEGVRFAVDSALEGAGFEPSVPRLTELGVEQRGRVFLAQNLIDPLVLVEPESRAGRAALDVIVANVVDQFALLAEPRDLGQGGEPDRGAHRVPTEPQDGMT
jgi:hypothetical protein